MTTQRIFNTALLLMVILTTNALAADGVMLGEKAAAVCAYGTRLFVDTDSIGGTSSDDNKGTIGKPFKTIEAALKVTRPGSTIFLRGGVYYETVIISNGGTKNSPLTIKPYNGEDAVIDGQNQREQGIVFPGPRADLLKGIIPPAFGKGDYVHIEGIRLVNFNLGPDKGTAIEASGRKGIVINNVLIANAGVGVRFWNCDDSKILNSEIHHCSPIKVLSPSNNIHIDNNKIHHGTGRKCYAVNVWGPGDASITRGQVHSLEKVAPGIAECSVKDVDLTKINTWGRKLQGYDGNDSKFIPNSIIFYYEKSKIRGDSVRNPCYLGDVKGGQKLLKNGKMGFVLQNNPEWDDKPYSPDGKRIRFRASDEFLVELKKAKYAHFINTWNPKIQVSRDIFITNNIIHNSNCQGIQTTEVEYLFIRGNRLYNNGASGMQIEDNCRYVWIEGNISYGNSVRGYGECGIWITLDKDVVVQNNIMYESQAGFNINQCQRALVRWNRIFDNRAQHAMAIEMPWLPKWPIVDSSRIKEVMNASAGVGMQGGGHGGISAPPIIDESAFVHNTLFNNGIAKSMYLYGSLMYGRPELPGLEGENIILNNIVSSQHNENIFSMFYSKPYRIDGNLYEGPRNARILHCSDDSDNYREDTKKYPIGTKTGFEAYKNKFNQDMNSVFGNPAFVDPAKQNFNLQADSDAIDIGVPLAYTVSEASGTTVPITNTWAFSDGFRTSKGEVIVEGDIIMLGEEKVRIISIDRDNSTLKIDRVVSWAKNQPISYEFSGGAPDAGVFEYGLNK